MLHGYPSLIWQIPLATIVFVWSFLAEMPFAAKMAWYNSFASIKIRR